MAWNHPASMQQDGSSSNAVLGVQRQRAATDRHYCSSRGWVKMCGILSHNVMVLERHCLCRRQAYYAYLGKRLGCVPAWYQMLFQQAHAQRCNSSRNSRDQQQANASQLDEQAYQQVSASCNHFHAADLCYTCEISVQWCCLLLEPGALGMHG
jgi:hypothetical protein